MRTALVLFFIILYFLIITPLLIIGFIIGLISKPVQYAYSKPIARFICRGILWFTGSNITVIGTELIPNETVLFVGNHKSQLDTPLLIYSVNRPVGFIAKKEVKKIPYLNWITMQIGSLYLDRNNTREAIKTIRSGIELLKNGHSLIVFPEGTRSKTDELLPFKKGSLKLAEKANVPILPFAIKGTDNVLENNNLNIKANPVTLIFGEPIYLNQLSSEDKRYSAKYVQAKVEELLKTC